MLGEQGVGVGTHGIEGDIAQIKQASETDNYIEAPGQHHVNQDLDAEIVDPFQRAANQYRIEEKKYDRQLGPVLCQK